MPSLSCETGIYYAQGRQRIKTVLLGDLLCQACVPSHTVYTSTLGTRVRTFLVTHQKIMFIKNRDIRINNKEERLEWQP